jgi:hypothetical protein
MKGRAAWALMGVAVGFAVTAALVMLVGSESRRPPALARAGEQGANPAAPATGAGRAQQAKPPPPRLASPGAPVAAAPLSARELARTPLGLAVLGGQSRAIDNADVPAMKACVASYARAHPETGDSVEGAMLLTVQVDGAQARFVGATHLDGEGDDDMVSCLMERAYRLMDAPLQVPAGAPQRLVYRHGYTYHLTRARAAERATP